MDSVLESTRKLHEERERLLNAIVKENLSEKKTHKAKVNSELRVKKFVDRYHEASAELAKYYIDDDHSRHIELDAVAGPNEFAEFYARLKTLKESHRRTPEELAEPLSVEFQKILDEIANPERAEPDMAEFSDEEAYGRFLDLHALFAKFCNLKSVKHVDYMTYLNTFDKFSDIPRGTCKKTGMYKDYLVSLKDYLMFFMARTRPLYDLDEEFRKSDEAVEKMFDEGGLPGWPSDKDKTGPQLATVDLSPYNSAAELEGLGLERLKGALMALGLKCGGTLKERAERLFATKGHKLSDMEKAAMASNESDAEKQRQRNLLLAKFEAQVQM